MKTADLLRELENQGWRLDRTRGSHRQFKHRLAKRTLTVPVHGKDIPDVLAKLILKQARAALDRGR